MSNGSGDADYEPGFPDSDWESLVVEEQLDVAASEVFISDKRLTADAAERIEENIASRIPKWEGVRSCNSQERADEAARPVAQQWLNEQIAANPGREVLAAAYSGTWRYENRGGSPGRRRCKGLWTECIVYVDFAPN